MAAPRFDVYGFADQIVGKLRALGHNDWASRIEDVIAGGSTGTEIFMGLRHTMQQLRAMKPELPCEIIGDARRLEREISKALRRATFGF